MDKKIYTFLSLIFLFIFCSPKENNKLKLSGYIEVDEINLSFRVNGQLTKIFVQEGQNILKNDTLAQLDTAEYSLLFSIKESELSLANTSLNRMESGLRPQEIGKAYQMLKQAKLKLDQSSENYYRLQVLYDSGDISQQTSYDIAKAQYNIISQEFSLASEGYREEDIEVAFEKVSIAKKALELALIQLKHTTLISPFDGTILSVYSDASENIRAGSTILTLASLDTVTVKFWISEKDIGKVKLNDRILVFNDSYSNRQQEGRISFISQKAEFTPSIVQTTEERTSLVYEIKAIIPNPDMILKPGMPVVVEITLEK